VDEFCAETRTVYEVLGCVYHGHNCLNIRDVPTITKDFLAEKYEEMMARIHQKIGVGYTLEVVLDVSSTETFYRAIRS
jgi:G:T-mismatch repair DNA endonuclease (very short patch repair protein)